jgi:fibronectin type 3 domain-containing protein
VGVSDGAYSAGAGYGWISGSPVGRDRGTGGDLLRDHVATADATFAVDLPNGTYQVTVTLGDEAYAHDHMAVYMEGTLVDTVSTAAGAHVDVIHTVVVADGQLTVRFDDAGGADPNVVVNALVVTT